MQAPFAYLLMNASRLRSACAFIFKWSVDVYSWTAGECNEYAGTSISLMNLQRISFYLPFMHLSLSLFFLPFLFVFLRISLISIFSILILISFSHSRSDNNRGARKLRCTNGNQHIPARRLEPPPLPRSLLSVTTQARGGELPMRRERGREKERKKMNCGIIKMSLHGFISTKLFR